MGRPGRRCETLGVKSKPKKKKNKNSVAGRYAVKLGTWAAFGGGTALGANGGMLRSWGGEKSRQCFSKMKAARQKKRKG